MQDPTYTIWISTGDEPLGGTDSNVYIMLFGENGQTDWIFLPPPDVFAFEEGNIDKFLIDTPDLGALTRVCVAHDAAADSGWYVTSVKIRHNASGDEREFAFNAWVGDEEAGRRVVCAPE